MTIIFQIDYAAQWGDELVVRSSLQQEPLAMRCLDGRRWEAALEVGAWPAALYYKYALRKADGELVYEAEAWRRLALEGTPYPAVALADSWRVAGERALIAAPYTSVLFRQKAKGEGKLNQHACKLTVAASCIPQGCVLCATGSAEALGRWDRQRPLLMQPNGEGGWHTGFTPAASQQPICYKYALYDLEQRRIVGYEQRADNRTLPAAGGAKAALWRDDGAPRFDLPLPRGAGVAIPVFALRSESGYGVGQFTDLKLLADWAKLAGLSMIQLLPVNDTSATATWADSYPYAGISVFALHPLYLDLAPLAACLTARQAEQLRREQAELNALREVDYEQAMRLKWKYARIAYAKEKSAVFASKEYQAFFAQRQEWLAPYAAFCYLRDQHGTADFAAWGDYATYSAAKVAALAAPRAAAHDELALHYYVQFLLHRQLQEATAYCRARGIVLKGDIPIGIARRSCDAWVAPHLYNMDAQAGAPPDAFSATGQNWGFPTYSWERMAADGYRWWQQRLRAMAEYFDAFRIDHVLGFFRIWEIPLGAVEGLLGCFSPALPLSVAELGQRGAWFDAERLCAPYLTPQVLRDA
ncbi:MAG: 4-alpha-glucanotransferase, partial [Prevotellaceae bacterium]|nr:4-alpha-glucanotransferase [Prevotellaceae bacterium]